MTGVTTGQTALTTATDSDDTEIYLTTGLVAALQALANLFESTTGHDHSGAGKGKPIIAAGVGSGAVDTPSLAAHAVTNTANVLVNADFSTSSATYVDVTGVTATITTLAGSLLLAIFSGPANATGGTGSLTFNVDGTDQAGLAELASGGQVGLPVSLVYVVSTATSAAAHTVKLRGQVTGGGTLAMAFSSRARGSLLLVELRR